MPFELQLEFTRSNLQVAPHVWDDYDMEIKGRAIATEVVKGHLETLRRFRSILKQNSRSKNSGNKSK